VDRPMRRYGPTVQEILLGDLAAGLGLALMALAAACAIWPGIVPARSGWLAAGAGAAGLLLALAGAGVRQNRAALDGAQGLLAVVALGWLVTGIVAGAAAGIVIALVLAALWTLLTLLRAAALRARYQPRFFSPRAFETMVAIADTMIDGDGREALAPIDVAVQTDHLLAEVRSPATDELKTVMVLVEWVLPLLALRPVPFSSLGSAQRRRVVEKVIGAGGLFRDVARSLKVLACAGYYGTPEGMRSIGYVPYEDRPRAQAQDTTPLVHPDPFPTR
jgi:hypothetical protein